MSKEKRLEPRELVALPLMLPDGCAAVTRDISPSGMYLVVQGDQLLGGIVFFELKLADARMRFSCEALIVRVDRQDGHTGIALKLLSPRLEPLA